MEATGRGEGGVTTVTPNWKNKRSHTGVHRESLRSGRRERRCPASGHRSAATANYDTYSIFSICATTIFTSIPFPNSSLWRPHTSTIELRKLRFRQIRLPIEDLACSKSWMVLVSTSWTFWYFKLADWGLHLVHSTEQVLAATVQETSYSSTRFWRQRDQFSQENIERQTKIAPPWLAQQMHSKNARQRKDFCSEWSTALKMKKNDEDLEPSGTLTACG